ncbi:MAG: hypothetical protein ACREHC_06300 [Candidatus Levyibacteriota bacterium]
MPEVSVVPELHIEKIKKESIPLPNGELLRYTPKTDQERQVKKVKHSLTQLDNTTGLNT